MKIVRQNIHFMARVINHLLSGKLGNKVYYIRNGVGYARQSPGRVKQAQATRHIARLFGKSRKVGKLLREVIITAFPYLTNRGIMQSLDNSIFRWLQIEDFEEKRDNLDPIERNEINEQSSLYQRFRKTLQVDFSEKEKVHLTIPKFEVPDNVVAPIYTRELHMHVLVTSCNVKNLSITGSSEQCFNIPFTDGVIPGQRISLDFEMEKDSLVIVVAGLRYAARINRKLIMVADRSWLPTAIIGSYYRGG